MALVVRNPRPGCRLPFRSDKFFRVTHLSPYVSYFDDSDAHPAPISCRVLGNAGSGKFTFIQSVFLFNVHDGKHAHSSIVAAGEAHGKQHDLGASDVIFDTLERLFDARRQAIAKYAKPGTESRPVRFSSVVFGYMDQPFVLLPSSCVENDKQYKQNVIILFVDASRGGPGTPDRHRLDEDTSFRVRYHVETNRVSSIIVAVNKMDKGASWAEDEGMASLNFQSIEWFNSAVDVVTRQLAEICDGVAGLRLADAAEEPDGRVVDVAFVPTSATTGRNTVHGTMHEFCDWYQGDTVMQILTSKA